MVDTMTRDSKTPDMDLNGRRSIGARYYPRLFSQLLYSTTGRRMLVLVHLFVFDLHHVARKTYKHKYKIPTKSGASDQTNRTAPNSGGEQQPEVQQPQPADKANSLRSCGKSFDWQWRDFPRMPSILIWYRRATTIYFIYVIIKYMTPSLVEMLVDALQLSKPAHCYALGQFMIYESVREHCAVCFATFHLTWRLLTSTNPQPLAITTIYFLILDDRDIKLYYQLLEAHACCDTDYDDKVTKLTTTSAPSSSGSIRLTSHHLSRRTTCCINASPNARLQMMHDVMSFRIDRESGPVYRLRPNRTAAACRNLRDYLINVMLVGTAVFAIIALTITLIFSIEGTSDQSYLKRYPNCDPYLEQLKRDGQLDLNHFSLHLTRQQFFAFFFDTTENVFLWLDSGLVLYSCVVCTLLLNYDLNIYWKHINGQIELLLEFVRSAKAEEGWFCVELGGGQQQRTTNSNYERLVYELQMKMRDFIKHLKRSDQLIGDVLTTIINVWFTLFAYFIYSTIVSNARSLPVALNITLAGVFMVTTLLCAVTISVHRNCMKSYGKICSLMTLDNSHHKQHFTEILDFFIRRRTCYTIYRGYEMTATTYLTLIGYSFSCFFILGSVDKRRR
jgi:hypothetical protein